MAAGDVGEIVVRSRFLSPGYWRRPAETATAFADAWTAQFGGKCLTPGLQVVLSRIESLAMPTPRPDGEVRVGILRTFRIIVAVMVREQVVVVPTEGLIGEGPRCLGDGLRIGARRHREDQIDGVTGALSPAGAIGPPFFSEVTYLSCAFYALAIVPFSGELAVAGDVGQVFLQAPEASGTAGHLDHHFRSSASDPPNLGA